MKVIRAPEDKHIRVTCGCCDALLEINHTNMTYWGSDDYGYYCPICSRGNRITRQQSDYLQAKKEEE